MNKFLNPAETMQELGISYATLLRKVKNGEIPFVKVGKSLRFPRTYFETLEQEAMSNMKGASHE
ncbi:MAG: helix-turn-helix domain-containing protein [Spirochaetales bacterium]|nr:helix-turn-helix domain-containing protein [Spirochaetales bacterium]